MIKHISFDVWNTLISPNPEFGKARNEVLARMTGVPVERVAEAYKTLKGKLDADAETTGKGESSSMVWWLLMEKLGFSDNTHWKALRTAVEGLFGWYQPIVHMSNIEVLRDLQAMGYTLSITSNTNFIRGKVLREVLLDTWDVKWSSYLFSDEILLSKPHEFVWNWTANEAHRANPAVQERSQILHVGDHPVCDASCVGQGIQFHQVGGPQDLASVLERLQVTV